MRSWWIALDEAAWRRMVNGAQLALSWLVWCPDLRPITRRVLTAPHGSGEVREARKLAKELAPRFTGLPCL